MKRKNIVGFLTVLLMVVFASAVSAARGPSGSGGWGMGGAFQRMYDPRTVETVSGEVAGVDRIAPMRGMGAGVHLRLKTDKEVVSVHLGPSWYLDHLDARIGKGDKIEVRGSRVMLAGKTVIIAAEVKRGDALLKLRDDNGVPVWAGWRR